MAVMYQARLQFPTNPVNEAFAVVGPRQPLLQEPLPTLVTFTCYLLSQTSLSHENKVGLLEPGGLLGPAVNPPHVSTYQALHDILPCNFSCGLQYLGPADELTASEIRLLLQQHHIPRMAIVNRYSLQMIKAAEYVYDR